MAMKYAVSAKGYKINNLTMIHNIKGNTKIEQITVPYYKILKSPDTAIFIAKIKNFNLKNNVYYLYLPQIDGSYLAVYSNGRLIGSYGFSKSRSGNFWYQPFLFQLPSDTNEIKIELSGVYNIGIDIVPTIISENEKSKYIILYFLTGVFLYSGIGIILILSLFTSLLWKNLNENLNNINICYSLSALFAAIWMFDLVPFQTMGSYTTMFIMRKIFVSSSYLSFAFFICATSRELITKNNKIKKMMFWINIIGALALLLTPNFYIFELFIRKISILLFINVLYLSILTIKNNLPIQGLFILFTSLAILYDSLILIFLFNEKIISPYGIVVLFFGIINKIKNRYNNLINKLSLAHKKIMIDPLTGAYTRGFLSEIRITKDDSIVFIDLNNFKEINDNYGHDVGDDILKTLVNVLKTNLRKSDYIIRMGGDEFLLILKGCPVEKAEEIMKISREKFKFSHNIRPDFSYGISPFISDFDKTLINADKLMYEMKRKVKQQNNFDFNLHREKEQ
nr:GGDEF domain-containing protein [Marinitoga okinawensis]